MTWGRAFALAAAFTILVLIVSGMIATSHSPVLGPYETDSGDDIELAP